MRKLGWIDQVWSEEARCTDNWPAVSLSDIPATNHERFQTRKRVLDEYVSSDKSVKLILKDSGMSKSGLRRLVDRAFIASADGLPVGYCACIPGFHIKAYCRTSTSGHGRAGRFEQFLCLHEPLRVLLEDWALGRRKIKGNPVRGSFTLRIWREFNAECLKAGIDVENSYPFTNDDKGQEAVRQYCRKVGNKDFARSTRVLMGDDAGRLADMACRSGQPTIGAPTRPYERVQLDGHKLDTLLTVHLTDEAGEIQVLPMSRIWLLVAIDCRSRAVLGYSLSVRENYCMDDVLQCIATTLVPWSRIELPTDRIRYHADAGLPSGVIDGCAWRIFDTLQLDNAWSHLSAWVQSRIIDAGALEVRTNQPACPRENSIVERFMRTFEEMSLHQLPMTTGSGPDDPRRRNPEKEALKFAMTLEDLALICDVTIANYNAEGHDALNGIAPLAFLRARIAAGRDLVRTTRARTLDGLSLFDREFRVTVKASRALAHRPYIQFKDVRYTGPALSNRMDLAQCKMVLRVNTRDIRTGQLFLSDGSLLGQVQAEPRWMERPHSLQIRFTINKLRRKRRIAKNSQTPLSDFAGYLLSKAQKSKKDRNRLVDVLNTMMPTNAGSLIALPAPPAPQPPKASRRGWISLDTALQHKGKTA